MLIKGPQAGTRLQSNYLIHALFQSGALPTRRHEYYWNQWWVCFLKKQPPVVLHLKVYNAQRMVNTTQQ